MLVSVILPCRNEEKTIGICIDQIKKVFLDNNIEGEIIVSDSSSDNSAKIAKEHGALIVSHGREGYGYAYQEGFKVANGEYIILGDSDGTYDFSELPKLLSKSHNNDLVIGSRLKGNIKNGSMSWLHRYIGNPLLSFILRILFKVKISDTQSGFRIIKRKSLEKLNLQTTGMEFASEMIIRAKLNNMKIDEVPITYYPRMKGSNSKLRSLHDGWKHLRFMLLFMNGYLFIYPSIILMLLGSGLLYMIDDFTIQILSFLLIIFGYQFLLTGVFAKNFAAVHLGYNSRMVDIMNKFLTLDRAILASLIFLACAFLVSLTSYKLFALAIGFTGFQTLFFVFFMSIVGLKQKQI